MFDKQEITSKTNEIGEGRAEDGPKSGQLAETRWLCSVLCDRSSNLFQRITSLMTNGRTECNGGNEQGARMRVWKANDCEDDGGTQSEQ
jgi:hypothetical protein